MNRLGSILLNIAVALYLFANGVLGLTNRSGEFETMIRTIFGRGDLSGILIIVLSVIAIGAGIFLLLELFNISIKITDLIIFIFVIVWAVFIVIVDIINPLRNGITFLPYLVQLASHLLVFGTLITFCKKFS